MVGSWPGQLAAYTSSARRAAATAWSAADSTVIPGSIRRQSGTPSLGNERFWICYAPIGGGTNTGGTDPLTTFTRGFIATDNTLIKWIEITGLPMVNGDAANTPLWSTSSSGPQSGVQPGLGQIVTDGTHAFVCIASVGATTTHPTWVTTSVGSQTTDAASNVWAYIGLNSSFTKWGAPHANIVNSMTTNWGNGPTQFFYGDDHSETGSGITSGNFGSAAAPIDIFCVDHTGSTPPVSADLLVSGVPPAASFSEGASSINLKGAVRVAYGLLFTTTGTIFASGSGDFTGKNYESCQFHGPVTAGGAGGGTARFLNCKFKFSSIAQFISAAGNIEIIGGSLDATGSIPTNLISGTAGVILLRGVDLSVLNTTIYTPGGATNVSRVILENCKLNSTVTLAGAFSFSKNQSVTVIESDSAGTNYVVGYADYNGTLTTNTSVLRPGGASDGTTGYSWKMAASAAVNRGADALSSLPMSIWNPTDSGTVNVTVYGMAFSAAAPKTSDVFMEVDYLGDIGDPMSLRAATAQDCLATTSLSALTTDTSAWGSNAPARQNAHATAVGDLIGVSSNGSVVRVFICTARTSDFKTAASLPGAYATANDGDIITDGNTTWQAGWRFSIAVATSPLLVGPIRAVVKVGVPSETVFVDPRLTLS